MRIFLDVNILVSVLNKEYPLFTLSSRILSLTDHKDYEVFTSPLCLAIAFYFAEKKNKRLAKDKTKLLAKHLSITPMGMNTVKKAIGNSAIRDFEDGLEYYAAMESKCDCIVTEDTGDFYFSDIEVLNCEAFFEKYLLKNR
jgi:predicted nucleic acid-binding protein